MIEELVRPASEADVRELAALLVDAVASGASVGFLDTLSLDDAAAWWRGKLASADPRAVVLVARDGEGIVGTVQLLPAAMPNQPHRADIAKLQVHRRARGRGLGRALMDAIETRAHAAGFTLLVLDTKRGDAAEKLYEGTGWTRVGVIPNYALDPDGSPCDTVVFYKQL
ncbi:MAG TPA: GNAT family N-acetyltransferase [Thermoanaerobaculia bacterium]|nr:GNAT family N-acetyltransferase [Thermoanaerobaculia bacterium]